MSAAFISYSREDSEFAFRLAKDLKAAGANVWLDQLDILPGRPWDNAIEDALMDAPQMLIVLSPSSARSDNVRNEISFALEQGKIVIPVLYMDCIVPLRLQRTQRIDFRADYARGLTALLEHLRVTHPDPSVLEKAAEGDAQRQAAWQAREAEAQRLREIAEQKAREEEETQRKATAERQVREEAERKEQEARIKAAAEREGREEAERKAQEAEALRRKEAAEREAHEQREREAETAAAMQEAQPKAEREAAEHAKPWWQQISRPVALFVSAVVVILVVVLIYVFQRQQQQQLQVAAEQQRQQQEASETWTDPATGLMWTKKDNGSDVNWQQAMDYCKRLQLAGHGDWRLATIDELPGIYDASVNIPGQSSDGGPFTWHVKGNLQLSGYQWSRSQMTDSGSTWGFTFDDGRRFYNILGSGGNGRALCVRRSGE